MQTQDSEESRQSLSCLTVVQVESFLRHHNLPEYVLKAFEENHVDGPTLACVDVAEDLTEIGLKYIHAKRLLALVREAKESGIPLAWLSPSVASRIPQSAVIRGPCELPAALHDICPNHETKADEWAKAFRHFVSAFYMLDKASLSWLEQNTVNGNNIAKAYFMVILWVDEIDKDRACLLGEDLQRNCMQRWLRCTNPAVLNFVLHIRGCCYYYGLGCMQDFVQAVELWKTAATQGFAQAQNDLGWCYTSGDGCARDFGKAREWYQKAADQGSAQGQFNMAQCFIHGLGVAPDLAQGVSWLRRAEKQGHAQAITVLGDFYFRGTPQTDKKAAIALWKRAAALGDPSAMFLLGERTLQGDGVPQSRSQAVELFQEAAKRGHQGARTQLKTLGVEM